MSENINVVPLRQPNEVDDPLTNILRSGARQLLAQAVEMEAEAFLLAMRLEASRRPRPPGAARPWPGADDPDGYRSRRGRAGEDSGSRGGRKWRADPLHLSDSSAVGASDEELGHAFAGALLAGHFDGRLPGGAGGTFGPERTELVTCGDFPADGRVAGRVRALAEARFVGATIRLRLG